jgi:hypothetical protein
MLDLLGSVFVSQMEINLIISGARARVNRFKKIKGMKNLGDSGIFGG